MPTTVHIPPGLLERIDRRAKALRVSRNRLIVRALEREVSSSAGWSPEYFTRLRDITPGTAKAVDELLASVVKARRSKRPLDL